MGRREGERGWDGREGGGGMGGDGMGGGEGGELFGYSRETGGGGGSAEGRTHQLVLWEVS